MDVDPERQTTRASDDLIDCTVNQVRSGSDCPASQYASAVSLAASKRRSVSSQRLVSKLERENVAHDSTARPTSSVDTTTDGECVAGATGFNRNPVSFHLRASEEGKYPGVESKP
jgi:hypothetical protein